jgi:hypothetical protein
VGRNLLLRQCKHPRIDGQPRYECRYGRETLEQGEPLFQACLPFSPSSWLKNHTSGRTTFQGADQRSNGMSIRAIAAEVGLSKATIQKILSPAAPT